MVDDEDTEQYKDTEQDEQLQWGSLEPEEYSSDESYEEVTFLPQKEVEKKDDEIEEEDEFAKYNREADEEEDEETKRIRRELLNEQKQEERQAKEDEERKRIRREILNEQKQEEATYNRQAKEEEIKANDRKREEEESNEDACTKYFPLQTRRSLPTLKKQLRQNLTSPSLKNKQSEINKCYRELKKEIESRMEDASAWELEQAREEIEMDKKARASQRKVARQNMSEHLKEWKGGDWKFEVPIVRSSDLNLSNNSEYKRYNIYANQWEDALPDSNDVIGGTGQILNIEEAKGWFARRNIPMPNGECTEKIIEAPMVRGRELKCNTNNLFVLHPRGDGDFEPVTFDPDRGYSLRQPDKGIHYIGTLVDSKSIVRQGGKKKTKNSKELTIAEMQKKAQESLCAHKTYITHFNDIVAMFDEAHNLNFKRETDAPLSDTNNAKRITNFFGIKTAISQCVNSVCVFFTATPYSTDISYADELFRVLQSTKYAGSPQNNFFIYYNDSNKVLLPKLYPNAPEVVDDETCDKFPLYLRLCSYDSIQIPKRFNEVAKGEVLSTAEIEDLITPHYTEHSDEQFKPPSQDIIDKTVTRDMERLNSKASDLEQKDTQSFLNKLFGWENSVEQRAAQNVKQSLAFLGNQKTIDEDTCKIDGSCFGEYTSIARERRKKDSVKPKAKPKRKPKSKAKKDSKFVMNDENIKEWQCKQDALTDKDLAMLKIDKKLTQWNIATDNFMGPTKGTAKGKYLDVLQNYCTVEKQPKNQRVHNPMSGNKYIMVQLSAKEPIALVGMFIEIRDEPNTIIGKFITTNEDTRCGPESTGVKKKSFLTSMTEMITGGEAKEEDRSVEKEHGYQCALDVRLNKETNRWEMVSNNFIGMLKEIYSHEGTSEVCFYSVGGSVIKRCKDFSQFRGEELEKYLQLSTQAYNYSQFPYTTATPLKAFMPNEIQRGKVNVIKHLQPYDSNLHDKGNFAAGAADEHLHKKKAFNELLDYFGQDLGYGREFYFKSLEDYKGKTLHIEYAPMLSQLIIDLYINVKLLQRKAFVFVSGKQMIWPMIRMIRKYLFNQHCNIYKKKEDNDGKCYLKLKKDNVLPIGDPDKKTNLSIEAFGMTVKDLQEMTKKEPCAKDSKTEYCPRKSLNSERAMKLIESKTISYWNKDLQGDSAAIMVVDIDTYSTGVSLQTTRDMYFFSIPKNWERLKQALGRPARTCRYVGLPSEKKEIYAHMYVPVFGIMNGKLPVNVPASPGAMLLNKVNRERRSAEKEAIERFASQHIGLKCDTLFDIQVPKISSKCNPE